MSVTRATVAAHNKADDLWVVINGKAYDVTTYCETHPGGTLPLLHMAGKDATDVFRSHHPDRVYHILEPYYVGRVSDYSPTMLQMDYRQAHSEMAKQGLFQTRYEYYLWTGLWLLALFAAAVALSVGCSTLPGRLAGACVLGCFWQQIAGVGHDVGHNGVTHRRDVDGMIGLLAGNLLAGISMAWWKQSHNVHHVVTNSIEHDPDIQHAPIFAVTYELTRRFFSSYHRRWFNDARSSTAMVGIQHWLFYPVMAVARFNLYAQSWMLLLSTPSAPSGSSRRWAEICANTGFVVWLSAMVAPMPVLDCVLYLLVSHAVAGVLHVQICLSHFSMPTYHGNPYDGKEGDAAGTETDWFRAQVGTTMNIDCPPWMDWFHIGLHYQIEHHLWPRMPRHNLRRASVVVRKLCARHKVPYRSLPWIRAQIELLTHLKCVATKVAS